MKDNKIIINKVNRNHNQISISYSIEGEIQKYFNEKKVFTIEYNTDINNVPESICVIPFIANILPIVWLTDAILIVDSIDEEFYNSIDKFKQGYINMYPHMKFKGEIIAKNIDRNIQPQPLKRKGAFFSGGVDAFATLIAHISELSFLITIIGADIKLNDQEGIKNVSNQVTETCNSFNLNSIFIKSNFREFIKEHILEFLVKKSGDGWWHGFQHGIGIISQIAPIAYSIGFETVYIASSYTSKDKVTCASHPSIDNNIAFCQCHIKHDQYEYTRQEKINHICNYVKATQIPIKLRVCWISRGGNNCCKCEKCYRTIMGILAEGEDPNKYGFNVDKALLKQIKIEVLDNMVISKQIIVCWKDIQQRMSENFNQLAYKEEIKWICKTNFNTINIRPFKFINRIRNKIKYILKTLIKR